MRLEMQNMAVQLPMRFLRWNYFSRRDMIKNLLEGKYEGDINLLLLDGMRHNPALCTAFIKPDGRLYVNAKIIGAGYVLKEEFLQEAIEALSRHVRWGDDILNGAVAEGERREAIKNYQYNGMLLLLRHLYLDHEEAMRRVDFTKMATVELALSKPHSSKHTWSILQKNDSACLLFYRPPNISFEIHGSIEVYEKGPYHRFVNLVHDSYHYSPPEKRKLRRPVYIFNVEEVYDNSPTAEGFGRRIA